MSSSGSVLRSRFSSCRCLSLCDLHIYNRCTPAWLNSHRRITHKSQGSFSPTHKTVPSVLSKHQSILNRCTGLVSCDAISTKKKEIFSPRPGLATSSPFSSLHILACSLPSLFSPSGAPRTSLASTRGAFPSQISHDAIARLSSPRSSSSRPNPSKKSLLKFRNRVVFREEIDTSSDATADVAMEEISYLGQKEAIAVDEELMGRLGFSVDQLMELAGLSVACTIAEVYPVATHPRVLIVCGPGNNGGDGLVAARHLHHFCYRPVICYPKRTDKPLFKGLITQLEQLRVPFVSVEDMADSALTSKYDVVVDAIFGFSFRGTPRAPFDRVLKMMAATEGDGAEGKLPPIVSVDIPSGWDVEEGDVDSIGLKPNVLVSLTAPKLCARKFQGLHHFLGGRFVPPVIGEKYKLKLPPYPGTAMCVRIGRMPPDVDVAALRISYEKGQLTEDKMLDDPIEQFRLWFHEAREEGIAEPNAMALATVDARGYPSVRVVLLKGYDHSGFVWYTNYESRKGSDLMDNPRAAIVFWWEKLQKQVRIEGPVEKVSDEESDTYFHSRPRGSQLGAWASMQSSVIPDRSVLDAKYVEAEAKFKGREIERPRSWGGFRLRPEAMEFWQGRQSRLHDRLRFVKVGDLGSAGDGGETSLWTKERLAP